MYDNNSLMQYSQKAKKHPASFKDHYGKTNFYLKGIYYINN